MKESWRIKKNHKMSCIVSQIFILKVGKTVFLQNFKANFQWLGGDMGAMVTCCAQLTLGGAEWSL
jgi:hypothetical protein